MTRWKKLPKREAIDLIEAVLRRVTWLYEDDAKLENGHLSRLRLIQLMLVLFGRKLPFTEPQLLVILDLSAPLLVDAIGPDGPVAYVTEYLKQNNLTPELCQSLRNFQANLTHGSSQASMQSIRQRLHMWLWLDEWDPVDPKKCWSERIRGDFRSMSGDERVKWRRLLKNIRGNLPVRMPASWVKEAEKSLAEVTVEGFRDRLAMWFEPFKSGQPLPLSVAGSHVLKVLIWYAALTRDERVKEIAYWLLEAKWKQKRNIDKSLLALEVFGMSREDLQARNLIKPITVSPGIRLDKLNIAFGPQSGVNMAVDADEDMMVVQGQQHFYRIHRSSGRIERASDNAVLELNWPAIPDHYRLILKRECDSDEQLMLRASLLMNDSIYGDYFKVKC